MTARLLASLLASCLLAGSGMAQARIVLPSMFSDHGVLQRNKPIHIWGAAKPGERLRIAFRGEAQDVTASAHGFWETHLRPQGPGGPFTLVVESQDSSERVQLVDLFVGDVWFASGQSNMEMPLEGFPKSTSPVNDGEKAIAVAANPRLRLLAQTRRTGMAPMWDSQDRWSVTSPQSARGFSAIAYSFGEKLIADNDVPVGLIEATWGGTPAHAWMSAEGIGWAGLGSVAMDAGSVARQQALVDKIRDNHAVNPEVPLASAASLRDHLNSYIPSSLYNGMIAPYAGYTISGWIWYQGETDANEMRPAYYSRVFPALIQDWRKQWGQGTLPFLYVQLSSFGRGNPNWGVVRDAQRRTEELANTGMVVALDVGARDNIHPPEKFTLGRRFAALAQSVGADDAALHKKGKAFEGHSPRFLQATSEGMAIRAWFDHAQGLVPSGPLVGGFEIAGEDRRFVTANARIEMIEGKASIVARAPGVPAPRFVRYGWAPYVSDYIYNSAGLPLGTFTSESDSQMVTP
ncbi:MAG: sialate O-acetylesterase [Luteolibacter sp.]